MSWNWRLSVFYDHRTNFHVWYVSHAHDASALQPPVKNWKQAASSRADPPGHFSPGASGWLLAAPTAPCFTFNDPIWSSESLHDAFGWHALCCAKQAIDHRDNMSAARPSGNEAPPATRRRQIPNTTHLVRVFQRPSQPKYFHQFLSHRHNGRTLAQADSAFAESVP